MTKLLLIEDDATLREPLTEHLQKNSFAVTACDSLLQARQVDLKAMDIVILDWELGDGQGIDFVRELRAAGHALPVIFLTARTELVDKLIGLELGADDYMTKPFEVKELLARIRARLRQKNKTPAPASALQVGELKMDLDQRVVTYKGKALELAKMEFELLKFFMENPRRALGRDEILNKVWGFENFPSSRTVDTHVAALRQKINSAFFETLHGVGYRFKTEEK